MTYAELCEFLIEKSQRSKVDFAGVIGVSSPATVYNILNGDSIAAKTKRKLSEVANSYGYAVEEQKDGTVILSKLSITSEEVFNLLREMNGKLDNLLYKYKIH